MAGLLEMMGQGNSPFAQFLQPRANFLQQAFAGMVGADSMRDAMRGAAHGGLQGQQMDTAYAQLRDEQQKREQAVNQTSQWVRQMAQQNSDPRWAALATGLESGAIDPNTAFSQALGLMQPPEAPEMTADQRNWLFAQQNPEFAEFLGIGANGMTDTQRNLAWRAQQAGLVPGSPEWQEFMLTGGSSGTSLSVSPDGTVQFVQGAGRPLTEQQSKDAVYATRAAGALPIVDQFGNELTNWMARTADGDPTGLARGMFQSPEFQQAQQAGLEFLQAILRKDTGAAITSQEQEEYGRVYLPQPGDTPEVLAQKQASRQRALWALMAGMPPQAILNMERALQQGTASVGNVTSPGGANDPLGIR